MPGLMVGTRGRSAGSHQAVFNHLARDIAIRIEPAGVALLGFLSGMGLYFLVISASSPDLNAPGPLAQTKKYAAGEYFL
jgi:hypothetical protein